MNKKGDEDRRTAEYQKSLAEAANKRDRLTTVLEEKPNGSPTVNASTKYEQTRAYAYAYLASQFLIALVAGGGIVVAICSLQTLNQSVGAATKQAVAAATQARIAQQTLEANDRPWIEVVATPKTPLTFDKAGGHITITYQLKNYGKSPATYVFPYNTRFTSPWNSLDALEYQKQCVEARALKKIPEAKEFGAPIFPGTVPRFDTENLQLDEADIVASEKTATEITHSPVTTIKPQIVGCYIYRFREKLYSTDFRYELSIVDPANPSVLQPIKPDGTVPLSDLKFTPCLVGNNA